MSSSLAIEPIELTKGLLRISIGVKVLERWDNLTVRFAVLIITLHILFLLLSLPLAVYYVIKDEEY